ncbi:MAG: acylhydrolase [Balneolaceae bacterium]|nr:MAG: acylhydrolase [Balneolaceae bacterium]
MKHIRIYLIGISFSLLLISPIYSQNVTTSGKSAEQIMQEYEQWSATRDDWANLNRYRDANKAAGLPKEGERRVVFMGNSITEGWSNHYPEFFEGKPYMNRGISGQTTPQMLVRFRSDVIELKPEVVVILAGTNDIAGNTGPSTINMITDNLFSMAELASVHGIRVILSSVLPVYDYPWRPGLEPSRKIVELNNRIRYYAAMNGHYYLDYFSETANNRNGMKENLAYDGVHPNREGYILMSRMAEEAIRYVLED